MVTEALERIISGAHLTQQQAYEVLRGIMSGEATDPQIAGLLIALRMKGEDPAEVAGFAQAMRAQAVPVPTQREKVVDTCGTGGDQLHTFNISTCAAFVAAGAGVPVAKHGNRAVSSQCGSADVLLELGVNIELGPEQVGRCIDEVGMGFLFAPKLHPAMRYAMGPRRELGLRTVFNILGPLTNPAQARRQVIGTFSHDSAQLVGQALRNMDAEHALVVHGHPGMDEISTVGPTHVLEIRGSDFREILLDPEDLGVPIAQLDSLAGGDPANCAGILRDVLSGTPGPALDIVLLNAAAAIYVGDVADDIPGALQIARESVESGEALGKLEALIHLSGELADDDSA